jgi:hypothetical protein
MSIKVSTTVKIDGGATVSSTTTLDLSAHGTVIKTVPAESGGTPGSVIIPLQPEGADHVKLVMITASAYSEDLSYQATDSSGTDLTPAGAVYQLDQPQSFVGDAVKAIHANPNFLTFTNATADAITVTIVVARTAGN